MKSDQPVISVIIPVYNVEKFLRECLDSVLAQTFSDFEVLLVDDGSTDGSGTICDGYVERDPRVRVFHRENRGQAAARNFAVFQTEADWIAFVDSDDIVHPQYLEILLKATVEQDVRISMCDSCEGILPPDDFFDTVNSAHSEKITLDDDTMCFLHEEYKLKYCDVWGKLIDRTIIEKIPFTEGRIFEDAEVSCRWFAEAGEAADLDWGGYFYRTNPDGTMNKQAKIKWEDSLWAARQQLLFFDSIGYKKMTACKGKGYFYAARGIYLELSGSGNTDSADKIKKEFAVFREKFWDRADLSDNEREWILYAFYPAKIKRQALMKKAANMLYRNKRGRKS